MKSIVINIGNTNVRFGFFKRDKCEVSWIINTKPYRTSDEFFIQILSLYNHYNIKYQDIDRIIIGSVVPQLTNDIRVAMSKIHNKKNSIIVNSRIPSAVKTESKQMGTDIYANLVAANILYPSGKKIILDFGTALTVSCVDENAETLGVIIAPGIVTSLKSLIDQTAQLPEIELKKPKSILGKDTISCMQSGMVYGFLGMVEGFIDRINTELKEECYVIATGGISHVYKPLTEKIHILDKLHTLKGLYFLGNNIDN